MTKRQRMVLFACILTALFAVFTFAVMKLNKDSFVAHQEGYIKPAEETEESEGKAVEIGLSRLNIRFFEKFGESRKMDKLSNYLMILSIAVLGVMFLVWLVQIFKYRSFTQLDCELYLYGLFAGLLVVLYIVFEKLCVNYAPVLKAGAAEGEWERAASYPSSHVLCSVGFFGAAMLLIRGRLLSRKMRSLTVIVFTLLMLASVVTRLLSGQHWLTDIIGSVLLAAALLFWYEAAACTCKRRLTPGKE